MDLFVVPIVSFRLLYGLLIMGRIHPRRAAGSSRACAAVIWYD
jgi:hypothetical protein